VNGFEWIPPAGDAPEGEEELEASVADWIAERLHER
jgi:hypothetical protein